MTPGQWAIDGKVPFSVTVRVRDEDRLARFGAGWLRRLFAVYGVTPQSCTRRSPVAG